MVELIIIIVVGLIIYYLIRSKRKKVAIQYNPSTTKNDSPEIKMSVSVDNSQSKNLDFPDTGPITPSGDKGWILNPKSTFPLTIYGINKSIAEDLKQILDDGYSQGPYQVEQKLMPIVARYNIKCKEVDDYVEKFKPVYLKKIEDQIKASSEWNISSDLDKRDLLSEFKSNAIASLDIRPDCNSDVLFETDEMDLIIDDVLIDKYGYDTVRFYLSRKKSVHVIPADDYDREMFERLTSVGLAIRGEHIPLEAVLECLTLKELSSLVADLNPPKFSRKAKAIEFLLKVPDLRDRLNKMVSFRTLFQVQLLPEEFASIDLDKVSLSWQYAQELTRLICGTYFHGGYAMRNKIKNMEYIESSDFIKGWEISLVDDNRCCPYCRKAATKKYPKNQYPQEPLHIGCRCHVLTIFKND